MSSKLTPWFDGTVKPVRVGYYQRNYSSKSDRYKPDFWDGNEWRYGGPCGAPASWQTREWRGLAEKS